MPYIRNPTALTLLAEKHCPEYRWNRRYRKFLNIWRELKPLLLPTSVLMLLAITCVLGKLPEHVGNWLAMVTHP